MTKHRHYNIPVFIPELACPHQCIFCNQKEITGFDKIPDPKQVAAIIETHLSTINTGNSTVQVAFFGGSFTGIPPDLQVKFLEQVQPFIKSKKVESIRLSTRPDYISTDILMMLKDFGVKNIELGAQSMDDDVLKSSGRGHSAAQIVEASALIKQSGFKLGLQMMIGLPGDTNEKSMATANKIIECGAVETRIYPTLIIKDTVLEKQWLKGKYQPLTLDDAVAISAKVYGLFEEAKVKVLRTGLHASEDLRNGKSYLSGPFHPSFKELVLSKIWDDIFSQYFITKNVKSRKINITVNPAEINFAIGHSKSNLKNLLQSFSEVKFKANSNFKNRDFHVDFM